MFERYTDRARRTVVLAKEEALLHNHNYVGTEHLVAGLVHEGEGVAGKVLFEAGVTLERYRELLVEAVGIGQSAHSLGHLPFTPRAKKVLDLSFREALRLGHEYIGTEHLLLGLVREGEGAGLRILNQMKAGDLHRQVINKLMEFGMDVGTATPDDLPVNLRADGVLWAINRILFHPRGFALGYDEGKGVFVLYGDGSEVWRYGPPVNEDGHFDNFEALLERARQKGRRQ